MASFPVPDQTEALSAAERDAEIWAQRHGLVAWRGYVLESPWSRNADTGEFVCAICRARFPEPERAYGKQKFVNQLANHLVDHGFWSRPFRSRRRR